MAAVSSLSERPVTSIANEPQNSCDSRPAVSRHVETLVKEVLAWQRAQIPNKYSPYAKERNLANRFSKLLLRRHKALGHEPSRSQLSPSEVTLVNSIPGVPLHGCSVTGSCSNRGEQLETGRSKVRKKPATGSSISSRGGRNGRKKTKNMVSTVETNKKPAARDACSQANRQALVDLLAKAGAMAATRKPLVQAAGAFTCGGSGNGSGGVHSTAVAGDAIIMLLPAPISQQLLPPIGTPLGTRSLTIGTPQLPPFPKSWNTELDERHSEMVKL